MTPSQLRHSRLGGNAARWWRMNPRNRVLQIGAAAGALLLTGCNWSTPVAYTICDGRGLKCFVAARFQTMGDCERYREMGALVCDRTRPGYVNCEPDQGPRLGSSR
jgi:hypothetical protein